MTSRQISTIGECNVRLSSPAIAVILAAFLPLTGCSLIRTLEGPTAIPVNRVPPAVFHPPKSEMQEISLARLRQTPPEVYQLGAGDILGIYIETVTGESEEPPPVHFPEDASREPAIGYPFPIRDDGTVALPLVPAIAVEGLTVTQATAAIRKAYTVDQQILPADKQRVIVTLIRRRHYRVLVVREEAGGQSTALAQLGSIKHGTGYAVDLPAYENDLMHALTETGGLPGLDAKNEVIIYRGGFADAAERDALIAQLQSCKPACGIGPPIPQDPNTVRIPLRYFPHQLPHFTEEDIILQTGDIVLIESREREKFYTGGAIRGGEHVLPRDYDVDILQAVAIAGGTVGSAGVLSGGAGNGGGGGGFGGGGRQGGGLAPSQAIVIRQLAGGGQLPMRVDLNRALDDRSQRVLIQPEDVVIVRYTFVEELYNTALGLLSFNYFLNDFGN